MLRVAAWILDGNPYSSHYYASTQFLPTPLPSPCKFLKPIPLRSSFSSFFFFSYVKHRNRVSKPATKKGLRERERGRREEERSLPLLFHPTSRFTNPFASEHNFQSGRDPFTTRSSSTISGEDRRKGRKGNKGWEAGAFDRGSPTRGQEGWLRPCFFSPAKETGGK